MAGQREVGGRRGGSYGSVAGRLAWLPLMANAAVGGAFGGITDFLRSITQLLINAIGASASSGWTGRG